MKEQLFTQRGGARRGSANYTWPFERLTILKDGWILSGTKIPKENLVPNKLIDIRRGNAYAFPGSHLQRSPFVKEKLLLSPINRKLVIIFMVVLIFVGKQFSLAGESE
jgi:hypothetical protein